MSQQQPKLAGPAYPFHIDERTGGIAWAIDEDKLRHNVLLILGTRHGERPMLREFGTRVHSLVHDVNDDVLADLLKDQVRKGLLAWEPRIIITDVQVQRSAAEVQLRIVYARINDPVAQEMFIPLR